MIEEFKPIQETNNLFDETYLIRTIRNGELNDALKICKKNNLSFEKYCHHFNEGINKLIRSHRTSELLSFIYSHPDLLEVDKIEILKTTFVNTDYHGFLKNCFRFKIYAELEKEIEMALTKIREDEASSWRKKFNLLK